MGVVKYITDDGIEVEVTCSASFDNDKEVTDIEIIEVCYKDDAGKWQSLPVNKADHLIDDDYIWDNIDVVDEYQAWIEGQGDGAYDLLRDR